MKVVNLSGTTFTRGSIRIWFTSAVVHFVLFCLFFGFIDNSKILNIIHHQSRTFLPSLGLSCSPIRHFARNLPLPKGSGILFRIRPRLLICIPLPCSSIINLQVEGEERQRSREADGGGEGLVYLCLPWICSINPILFSPQPLLTSPNAAANTSVDEIASL